MQQRQEQQQQLKQGIQDWLHGPGAYNLRIVMGQHVEIIATYRDTDIIARFRVRQIHIVVLVSVNEWYITV